jgi:hypothetical protein
METVPSKINKIIKEDVKWGLHGKETKKFSKK